MAVWPISSDNVSPDMVHTRRVQSCEADTKPTSGRRQRPLRIGNNCSDTCEADTRAHVKQQAKAPAHC